MAVIHNRPLCSPMNLRQRTFADRVGLVHPVGEDMSGTSTTQRSEASFPVDGVLCRAWVYAPDASATRPAACIVMAHGLGGTRDAALEPYAERFAEAGFFVVLFDYRFLGASDGEPRQVVSIEAQLDDWRAAIAFARTLPDVDASRIGLWGCSLSGGHVIVLAARDKTIAAISAQCPMLDGTASAQMAMSDVGPVMATRMAAAALLDLGAILIGHRPHYVPLVAPHGELAAMSTPGAYEGCMAIVPPGWRNEVAARFLLTLPLYRPLLYARDVTCPTLLVACARDTIVSARAAADAAARIGDNARLVVLPIDHFDVYRGSWFERTCSEQIAFFGTALQRGDASVKAR